MEEEEEVSVRMLNRKDEEGDDVDDVDVDDVNGCRCGWWLCVRKE